MNRQLSTAEQLLVDLDRMGISVTLTDHGLTFAGDARDVPSDLYASLWRHVDGVAQLLQKRSAREFPRPARMYSFVRAGERFHGIFPVASEEAEDVLRRRFGEIRDVTVCTKRPKVSCCVPWVEHQGGGNAA